jgi:hypothetical protein
MALGLALSSVAPCDGKPADQTYVDAAIDGLVKAGVLTPDQARQIKDDAAEAAQTAAAEAKPPKPKWSDTIKLSGYTQARWLHYPDADGKSNEFLVRRARIKLGAQPTPRSEVELQLDLGEGDVTVKDAWVQYDLTARGDLRVRAGQQKVPFGFETPQSSGSRVPLERNWVSRRFVDGERDTGVTLYWTDPADAERFEQIKKESWGEGDYGNVAVGVFNGQGIGPDAAEVNSGKHVAVRLAKPFRIGNHLMEGGASYYGGRYHSAAGSGADFSEHLFGVHLYVPPQPLGFQGEWFSGETEGADLDGWYAMGLWRPTDEGVAFVRHDEYDGPRKGKGFGNVYDRDRWSVGYAHMLDEKTEVTAEYDFQDTPSGRDGTFGLQLQVSY